FVRLNSGRFLRACIIPPNLFDPGLAYLSKPGPLENPRDYCARAFVLFAMSLYRGPGRRKSFFLYMHTPTYDRLVALQMLSARPAGLALCGPPIWPQEPSKVLDQGAHFIAGASSSHGLSPAPECDNAGVAAGDYALDLARQGLESDSFLGLV